MTIQPYNVRVYVADFRCPYCDRAKSLLNRLAIPYTEYIGELPTGAKTYPQIYFGNTLIGGCDDLFRLHREGYFEVTGKPQ